MLVPAVRRRRSRLRLGRRRRPELTIATAPGYRGQGFGTKLLHAVSAIAVEMGFESISLSVDPNCPARRLYERAGFIHVGWDDTSMTRQRPVP